MEGTKAPRTVEPICPNCGNEGRIVEWGRMNVVYWVGTVEVLPDGGAGEVEAYDQLKNYSEDYEFDQYHCEACDFTTTDADELVRIAVENPHAVIQDNKTIARFATIEEATAYRESFPEAVRDSVWIDTPLDD